MGATESFLMPLPEFRGPLWEITHTKTLQTDFPQTSMGSLNPWEALGAEQVPVAGPPWAAP